MTAKWGGSGRMRCGHQISDFHHWYCANFSQRRRRRRFPAL